MWKLVDVMNFHSEINVNNIRLLKQGLPNQHLLFGQGDKIHSHKFFKCNVAAAKRVCMVTSLEELGNFRRFSFADIMKHHCPEQ